MRIVKPITRNVLLPVLLACGLNAQYQAAFPPGTNGLQGNGSKLVTFTGSGNPSNAHSAMWFNGGIVDSGSSIIVFNATSSTIELAPASGQIPNAGSCVFQPFQMYVFRDAPYTSAVCVNTDWLYNLGGQSVTPPQFDSYGWTNQGTATVAFQTHGVWSFVFPAHGSTGNSLNIYDDPDVPTGTSGAFTNIFRFSATHGSNGATDPSSGISLREGSTGKILTIGVNTLSGGLCPAVPCLAVSTWTGTTGSPTVVATSQAVQTGGLASNPWTVKIDMAAGASGLIAITWSVDGGVTFAPIYSAAKNAIFTNWPDNMGVFGNNNSNSKDIYLSLLSVD